MYIQCNGLSINSILSRLWVYIWLLSYKMAVWAKTLFLFVCFFYCCWSVVLMIVFIFSHEVVIVCVTLLFLFGGMLKSLWDLWQSARGSDFSAVNLVFHRLGLHRTTQVNTRYTWKPEPVTLRLIPAAQHLMCPKIEMWLAHFLFYSGCSNV